jgi:hypothetical protein
MAKTLTDQVVGILNSMGPDAQNVQLGTQLDLALSDIKTTAQVAPGTAFRKTVKLTAAAAATAVTILADTEVPAGQKVYIDWFNIIVNGATAWTDATATKVSVFDTNSSAIEAIKILKAQLTGNAIINFNTASIVLDTTVLQSTGCTAAKGLVVKADANFGAGSDIYVTIGGVIK